MYISNNDYYYIFDAAISYIEIFLTFLVAKRYVHQVL